MCYELSSILFSRSHVTPRGKESRTITVAGCSTSHFPVTTNPIRLAYQPPANSTFLSEQTSHQQPVRTSQQYYSLRTNQHQPSATGQPNKLGCRGQPPAPSAPAVRVSRRCMGRSIASRLTCAGARARSRGQPAARVGEKNIRSAL
jgi:hypothetical protein